MPCNCGKKNDQRFTYVYVNPRGEQRTFRTEIEARAAQIRAGGGGRIEAKAA